MHLRASTIIIPPDSRVLQYRNISKYLFPCNMLQGLLALLLFWLNWWGTNKCKETNLMTPSPTLCDPKDYNPQGSSVHGILQARILEWVAIPFCRESSRPRDQTWVSQITGRFLTIWATRKAQNYIGQCFFLLELWQVIPNPNNKQNLLRKLNYVPKASK